MYSNKNFYIYYNFVILHFKDTYNHAWSSLSNFNYLTFTIAIHKVSGQDSSEVKSYIFRKKKCMIIFCCAPIF